MHKKEILRQIAQGGEVMFKTVSILGAVLFLASCGEDWSCKVDGKSLYSVSTSGKLGSADKGCSCQEIRAFEQRTFGEVDESALKSNFGC